MNTARFFQRTFLVPIALAALLVGLAASAPAATFALRGATVYVTPSEKIDNATVLIRDDKIVRVGQGVPIPRDAQVLDAKGKVITAGLTDAYTQLGLREIDLESTTTEGAFAPSPDGEVHAAYRVTDGYNPSSMRIPILRAGGVTSALSVPRGGLIAGTSAVFSLAGGVDGTRVTAKAPAAMHASMGEHVLPNAKGSRGLAVEQLRELFSDAQQYARNKNAYDKNQSRKLAASRLDLEALQPVLRGQIPLWVNVERAADILALLRLAREFSLRVAVVGGAEAWRVAKELAAANVPVILDPAENLPSSFDQTYVRDDGPAVLARAGVKVALSPLGGFPSPHRLRQAAGLAVAYGLSWEQALAAITQVPADILGLKDRGTLRAGNVADLVVWSGDPLELATEVERVFIGGQEQPLKNRQTRLLERYR